ncbi:MAG TPA: hypothetical protein VGF45_03315 [Polyangia bacterium]
MLLKMWQEVEVPRTSQAGEGDLMIVRSKLSLPLGLVFGLLIGCGGGSHQAGDAALSDAASDVSDAPMDAEVDASSDVADAQPATKSCPTAPTINEFPVPNAGDLAGITTGPDGNVWFTDSGRGTIGRITRSGQITS